MLLIWAYIKVGLSDGSFHVSASSFQLIFAKFVKNFYGNRFSRIGGETEGKSEVFSKS